MQQNVSAAFPLGTTVISERHVTSGTILNQGTTSTTENLLNRGTQFATTGTTGNKLTGNYPTVTFRPLEAKFIKDKDFIGKMDPYCKFKIGWHSEKSSVAKSQGTNPVWAGDVITLKRKHNEEFVKIKLKDSDTLTMDDRLGDVKLRLDELATKGKVNQWFTLEKRGKATGEILLDIEYHNGPSTGFNAPNTGFNAPTTGFTAPNTGFNAPNTGFNAPNTGFNAPNTGFNAPTTGFVAPTTGFADQRVASNLPYNTAPGTLPTTVGVLPTAGTLPHTAGTTGSHGIINGKHDTVTFRPIEGKFLEDKDLIGKMDPYCKFKIGWHTGKSSVAKNQGVHPVWSGDAVTLKRKHGKEFAKIKIKDKDMLINDRLGSIKINLNDLAAKGRMSQWFPVEKRGKMTGEVLLEIDYNSAGGYQTGVPTGLSTGANQVPIA